MLEEVVKYVFGPDVVFDGRVADIDLDGVKLKIIADPKTELKYGVARQLEHFFRKIDAASVRMGNVKITVEIERGSSGLLQVDLSVDAGAGGTAQAAREVAEILHEMPSARFIAVARWMI